MSVMEEVSNMNWGAFKPKVAEAIVAHLEPIQAKYAEVMSDPSALDKVSLSHRTCILPVLLQAFRYLDAQNPHHSSLHPKIGGDGRTPPWIYTYSACEDLEPSVSFFLQTWYQIKALNTLRTVITCLTRTAWSTLHDTCLPTLLLLWLLAYCLPWT